MKDVLKLRAEVDRLQDAKRRALAIADERSKEANALRARSAVTDARVDNCAEAIVAVSGTLFDDFSVARAAARAAIAADAEFTKAVRGGC
jgi:hypothetical protein